MGTVRGFNVGVMVSLGDMELALDYVNNPEVFKPDIDNIIKDKSVVANDKELVVPSYMLMSDDAVESYDNDAEEGNENSSNVSAEDNDEDSVEIEVDTSEYFEDGEEGNDEEGNDEETEEFIIIDEDEGEDEDYEIIIDTSNDEDADNEDDDTVDINYDTKNEQHIQVAQPKQVAQPINKVIDIKEHRAERQDTINNVSKAETKSQRELELERKLELALNKLSNAEERANSSDRTSTSQHNQIDNEPKQTQAIHKPIPINKAHNVQQASVQNKQESSSKAIDANKIISKIERYNNLDVDALYKEVKVYMSSLGVKRNTIDRGLLDKEFGIANVRKLLHKSYLIAIGNRITTGK